MPSSLWLKILDDFIFDQSAVNGKQIRSLYDGSFIKKCTNLIFVGGTGKGKTHLSIAIAAHAVKDQGCQVSMDRRGAWRDNIFVEKLWKTVIYERVYLHAYNTVTPIERKSRMPQIQGIKGDAVVYYRKPLITP